MVSLGRPAATALDGTARCCRCTRRRHRKGRVDALERLPANDRAARRGRVVLDDGPESLVPNDQRTGKKQRSRALVRARPLSNVSGPRALDERGNDGRDALRRGRDAVRADGELQRGVESDAWCSPRSSSPRAGAKERHTRQPIEPESGGLPACIRVTLQTLAAIHGELDAERPIERHPVRIRVRAPSNPRTREGRKPMEVA